MQDALHCVPPIMLLSRCEGREQRSNLVKYGTGASHVSEYLVVRSTSSPAAGHVCPHHFSCTFIAFAQMAKVGVHLLQVIICLFCGSVGQVVFLGELVTLISLIFLTEKKCPDYTCPSEY